jgi:aryl-alcohol dehydrogenase-like predicted oxidoreductase
MGDGLAADWPKLSVLGFGCAAMGGRSSRKESMTAIAAAWDAGITFYDTARSYGYGQSEGLVGEFLQGRRGSAVICTKFGILPGTQGGWKQKLKPLARGALKVFPGLRGAVRRQIGDQMVSGQFSVETLRSSFETSLRELKTNYVDMLLLHAAPVSVLEQDDLLEALDRLVESGKVRMAGISGEQTVMERYFAKRPKPLATAQFALNLSSLGFAEITQQNKDLLLVANHPYGGPAGAAGGRAMVDHLRGSQEISSELREKLDPADPQVLPELVLNSILNGTGVSAVIAAMMQVRHVTSNIRAVESCRFSAQELTMLRDCLVRRGTAAV